MSRQNKSRHGPKGCVKPILTPSESTLITMRCVRLKAPCRSPPQHCASERGECTSSNQIEMLRNVDLQLCSLRKRHVIDEPIDAVISVGVPLSVLDLKFTTTTKLPHVVASDEEREFTRLPMRWQPVDSSDIHRSPNGCSWLEHSETRTMVHVDFGSTSTLRSTRR